MQAAVSMQLIFVCVQAGFFRHVVEKLFQVFIGVFPSCNPIIVSFEINASAWMSLNSPVDANNSN